MNIVVDRALVLVLAILLAHAMLSLVSHAYNAACSNLSYDYVELIHLSPSLLCILVDSNCSIITHVCIVVAKATAIVEVSL